MCVHNTNIEITTEVRSCDFSAGVFSKLDHFDKFCYKRDRTNSDAVHV